MNKNTKNKIIRRAIFTVAIIAVFLLQYTASFTFGEFSFPTGLLLPLTVSIAMTEREYVGLCFGLLSGVLTDFASSVTDGVFTLYFAVAACAAGLLAHYVFRDTVLTAMLFTTVFSIGFCLILLTYNCLIHDAIFAGSLISKIYLPSCLISVLLTPLVYFPSVALHRKLKADIKAD